MIFSMFIMALLAFSMEFTHLLVSLSCLEFAALTLFMVISLSAYSTTNESFHSLFYLAVAVCEAALGLSIVVSYTNKKGNQMLLNF